MSSFEKHFTYDQVEGGIELPIMFPNGKPSKDWVRIRSTLSRTFKRVQAEINRRALSRATKYSQVSDPKERLKNEEEEKEIHDEESRELLAALIVDWSFEQPCTKTNKMHFLKMAPQVAEKIDIAATQQSRFFTPPSEDLKTTHEEASNSNVSLSEASRPQGSTSKKSTKKQE